MRNHHPIILTIVTICVVMLAAGQAMAGVVGPIVFQVCPSGCGYSRIQDALDDSLGVPPFTFVEIKVARGTYRENLWLFPSHAGQYVTISGGWTAPAFTVQTKDPALTVIQGREESSDPVVDLFFDPFRADLLPSKAPFAGQPANGLLPELSARIENLTVTGGFSGATERLGGGILVGNDAVVEGVMAITLDGVVVRNNLAFLGGGMTLLNEGGRLFFTMTNSVIANNLGFLGGGLLSLTDVSLYGSYAGPPGSTSQILDSNTIVGNQALLGGGLLVLDGYTLVPGSPPAGGAAAVSPIGPNITTTVLSSIIWGNQPISPIEAPLPDLGSRALPPLPGADILVAQAFGSFYIDYCDRGNVLTQAPPGLYAEGGNNIDENPLLKAPFANNFDLSPCSPCVDAGTSGPFTPLQDYKGLSRPQGAATDMGADEYFPVPCAGDTVQIQCPGGGEVVDSGSIVEILWCAPENAQRFKIYYSKGALWYLLGQTGGKDSPRVPAAPDVPTWNYYWMTPPAQFQGLIKVSAYDAWGRFIGADVSDGSMGVEVLHITFPVANDVFFPGDPVAVAWETFWTRREVASARISLLQPGKAPAILGTVQADPGYFQWSIGKVLLKRTGCRIKVDLFDSVGNLLGSATGDPFTIMAGSPPVAPPVIP